MGERPGDRRQWGAYGLSVLLFTLTCLNHLLFRDSSFSFCVTLLPDCIVLPFFLMSTQSSLLLCTGYGQFLGVCRFRTAQLGQSLPVESLVNEMILL